MVYYSEAFMGKTRNNQSRAVTEEKIRNLIRDLIVQEQTVFPSERELSARVGGSRTVIREILEKSGRTIFLKSLLCLNSLHP